MKKLLTANLNFKKIKDKNYAHRQKFCAGTKFRLKNIGDYHDLYVQSDTLLLADKFENFRNKCIQRY